MKKLIIILPLLINNYSFAQKVDLDKYSFATNVVSLPEQYIEKVKRTYLVNVSSSADFGKEIEASLKDGIQIPTFTKTESSPTIKINVNLNRFKFLRSEVSERVVEEKAKDGKITKTYYYKVLGYWDLRGDYEIYGPYKKSAKQIEREEKEKAEALEKAKEKNETIKSNSFLKTTSVASTIDSSAIIANVKERPAYRRSFSLPEVSGTYSVSIGSGRPCYISSEYSSRRLAADDFSKNFAQIEEQLFNSTIQNGKNSINSFLNYSYGYYPSQVGDFVWILDSKKHSEYQTQKEALDAAKILFKNIKAEEPIGQIASDFQPLIDYFESLPEKYKTDEKNDKKMRYGAYFNLAKIYYYLDMPDLSIKAAEKLIANDYDTKDGEKLIEQANNLKYNFENLKVKGQHFGL
jgi:hypothetical protein